MDRLVHAQIQKVPRMLDADRHRRRARERASAPGPQSPPPPAVAVIAPLVHTPPNQSFASLLPQSPLPLHAPSPHSGGGFCGSGRPHAHAAVELKAAPSRSAAPSTGDRRPIALAGAEASQVRASRDWRAVEVEPSDSSVAEEELFSPPFRRTQSTRVPSGASRRAAAASGPNAAPSDWTAGGVSASSRVPRASEDPSILYSGPHVLSRASSAHSLASSVASSRQELGFSQNERDPFGSASELLYDERPVRDSTPFLLNPKLKPNLKPGIAGAGRGSLEAALALSSEDFGGRLSAGLYSPSPQQSAEPAPTLLRMPSREQLLSLANCGQRILRRVPAAVSTSDTAATPPIAASLSRPSASARPVPEVSALSPQSLGSALRPVAVALSTPLRSPDKASVSSRQTSAAGAARDRKSAPPIRQVGDASRLRTESGSSASAGGSQSGSRSASKSADVDADETDIDVDWDELSEALEPAVGSASGSVAALEQVGLGTPPMNRKYLFTPISTSQQMRAVLPAANQSPPSAAHRSRAENSGGSVPRGVAASRQQSAISGPRAAAAAAAIARSVSVAAMVPPQQLTEATGRFKSDSGTALTSDSSPASTRTSPQSIATGSSSKASSLQQSPSAPRASRNATTSATGATPFPPESTRSSSSNIASPGGLQVPDATYAISIGL